MAKAPDQAIGNSQTLCKGEIERMLKNSQTKVIMPVVAFGLLRAYADSGKSMFSDTEVRKVYQSAVRELKQFLGHDGVCPAFS